MKKTTTFIITLGIITWIIICYYDNASAQEADSIPGWIKNNAGWWYEGKISDSDFVQGMQYLVNQGIIKIPQTIPSSQFSQVIPIWIKTTAGGWADNQMSDEDFVKVIQYLVNQGIIKIPSPTQSPTEFVEVDKSQFVISDDKSVQVNIYGKVSRPNGGQVTLTITKPDGTINKINDYVTDNGDFSSPIILDRYSPTGQYEVTAKYENLNFGSISFNVISESALQTQTSLPTNTPSTANSIENTNRYNITSLVTSNNLTQDDRANIGGLFGSNISGSCPNGEELQYSSSSSAWVCSRDNDIQNANYIITKSGPTYSAKNGITNTVEFSDTNATKVIQNVIDKLSSNGGKIVFGTGIFPVSITVTKKNLTFEGQGDSTVLTRDGDKNIFNITGKSHEITRTIIKNMKIVGDPTTYQTDCIYAKETSLMTFDTLDVIGCYGNGIYFEEVWDSRILNSYFGYDGNQAHDKAALYLYSGSADNTNNIYIMNCDFETQQGDDVISRGLDLGNRDNYMINFLSDKFESHSNLVKHHINFANTKGSVIESSFIVSASVSNVYLEQTTSDIKLIANLFDNSPSPPMYNVDIQGKNMILIGNSFTRATLAHINLGPLATSTQILGNSYDLTDGEKDLSGNIENAVK